MTRNRADITPSPEEEGMPDLEDTTSEEGTPVPRDWPQGLEEDETTASGHRKSEPLEERLMREESDTPPDRDRSAGRLVDPEPELDERDVTKELVGRESEDRAGMSNEERAVTPDE